MKTFHGIVKHGSFIRAAEEMNYAQSTVTMQIQKLETDLGVQLFEREKRVRLTEAGRQFYDQSLDIVKRMEQMRRNLADLKQGASGHVRIGATEPTASCRLPKLLKRLMSEYPGIRMSVTIASTPVLCEGLLKGTLDLALCSTPDLGSELYFEPLFKEPFVVLMPENHPLAGQSTVTPDDLREHRLLITSATCPYRKKLEIIFQQSGIMPPDTMEVGSMTALPSYVESGLGIALVPKRAVEPAPPGTAIRAMSGDSSVDMVIGIACKSSDYPFRPASAKLYDELKREWGVLRV